MIEVADSASEADDKLPRRIVARDPTINVCRLVVKGGQPGDVLDVARIPGIGRLRNLEEMHNSLEDFVVNASDWLRDRGRGAGSRGGQGEESDERRQPVHVGQRRGLA